MGTKAARNRWLSSSLGKRPLSVSASESRNLAYLEVEAYNYAARAVYRCPGFACGSSYGHDHGFHYR